MACGVSATKVNYIKDLSSHIIDGKINLAEFTGMGDAAIIKQLMEIRGFGRWTAEIFLILALNRPDVLPADDFGLQKAIKEVFSLPAIMQKRGQVVEFAEPWRPWRSLATWYLWQKFDDTRQAAGGGNKAKRG
jgi:DNA-3-methyladenine glycosylase II